jgi:hypothetical protein
MTFKKVEEEKKFVTMQYSQRWDGDEPKYIQYQPHFYFILSVPKAKYYIMYWILPWKFGNLEILKEIETFF